jgi:hypothetical protein
MPHMIKIRPGQLAVPGYMVYEQNETRIAGFTMIGKACEKMPADSITLDEAGEKTSPGHKVLPI